MAEEKQNNQRADAEASITDEQLDEASGGVQLPGRTKYSNITLKRGYVSSGEPEPSLKAELQESDEIADEQLQDASGGDITLKRGYVSTDELWVWRKTQQLQEPDEIDEIKQGD